MKVTIKTPDHVIELDCEAGARLDDLILSSGILLDRPCGGRGTCGKCRVKAAGGFSEPSGPEVECISPEDLEAGVRLACLARVEGDAEVEIESGAMFTDKTFTTGADPLSESGDFGLAIDLGTTTAAAFLVGLESGRVYAGNATLNQQAAHGAEVMSRIAVAEKESETLSDCAWSSIRLAASGLGLEEDICSRVTKAVCVGNSAMHHLALGLSIASLIRSPFEPSTKETTQSPPGALASLFPKLKEIRFPPLIGGFVGSDALACLAFFGLGRQGEAALAIDLGTNGEVMVAKGGRILAASAAAGPAFEGVNISCGMRAVAGAITSVRWERGHGLAFNTIGNDAPRGLSGSGLLSAVRLLRDLGAIESSGRIREKSPTPGIEIIETDGKRKIVLADGVWIGQDDVRELQKAKGAVRAAVEILLLRLGLNALELGRVILTGSFGGSLESADVLGLGIIPEVPKGRIYSIPNGAGMGAAMMLDDECFDETGEMAARVEHIELNLDRDFMDRYVTNMILAPDAEG